MTRPPNIVFILADDLGWGDLGCYGHPLIKTPNLDRLASRGTLFTHFYSASPVCSPSRAAFMTGQFPAKLGIHDYLPVPLQPYQIAAGTVPYLNPAVATLTRVLKQAGYVTGHFGKWHLGDGPDAPEANEYGIDVCRITHGRGPGYGEWWDDPGFRARASEMLVDELIQFLEKNPEQPIYANLWLLDPHATLNPTEEQMAPYAHLRPGRGVTYPGAMTVYYSVVTNLDAQIGRLLARLDELGLADNTILIFSSDNGPEDICIPGSSHSAAGDTPFRGRKRSLYDGGIRMPFIVSWPGTIPQGKVNNSSVIGAVDLLPTLCAVAGIDTSALPDLDGEDISDILSGNCRQRTKPLYWDWRFNQAGSLIHHSPQLAIREGNWKLLMNRDGGRVELYDLSDNRLEVDNVANQYPDVAAQLARRLLDWHRTLPPGQPHEGSGTLRYKWPT